MKNNDILRKHFFEKTQELPCKDNLPLGKPNRNNIITVYPFELSRMKLFI